MKRTRKTIGWIAMSFGFGILIATVFPSCFLVSIMALLTIITGCCILKC